MNTRHGVWTKRAFLTPDQTFVVHTPQETLSNLCRFAEHEKLTHLWIWPDTGIVPNKAWFQEAYEKWDLRASWYPNERDARARNIEQTLVTAVGWRRPHGNKIVILFPYNGSWEWIDEQLTPPILLETVSLIEDRLEVEMGNSPGSIGMRYLEKKMEHHKQWLARPKENFDEYPFKDAASDIIWDRPLTATERRMRYLHKYDKNSAYLRACTEENMGGATFFPVNGSWYNHNFPGVWRCSVTGHHPYEGMIPSGMHGCGEWISTPIVKKLMKLGYGVKIHEGYCYPESSGVKHYHSTLNKWASDKEHGGLWEWRQELKTMYRLDPDAISARNAYNSMKQIATHTIGLVNYGEMPRDSYKHRPDWRTQIIGGCRALMFYKMVKYAELGFSPVIIYMDALYYVSNDPDPATAIPDILRYSNSLGGYKHEWTLPMSEQTQHIIDTYQDHTSDILKHLNKLAGEK